MNAGNSAISRDGHTFSEKVEEALRRQIIIGERPAGSRLNEVEIAAEMDVSRGPVREAMQRLARDRLIYMETHRGAFVRELKPAEVRELFEVRTALECAAAALAAERANESDIDELRVLLEQSGRAIEAEANPHYPERLDLHSLIARVADNPALEFHLNQVNQELKLARAQSGFSSVRAPRAFGEHTAIVEAIARGDGEAAGVVMRRHLESALANSLALLGQEAEAPAD